VSAALLPSNIALLAAIHVAEDALLNVKLVRHFF
jgi:hypothetical protein